MSIVPTHTIDTGVFYQCHPHHRNNNPNKSQWTIIESDEVDCFHKTWSSQWIDNDSGWGLHLVNNAPRYLGTARVSMTLLFVAKFVRDPVHAQWHGYPADHTDSFDRPVDRILNVWLAAQFLPPAKIRKIQKGQPCSL